MAHDVFGRWFLAATVKRWLVTCAVILLMSLPGPALAQLGEGVIGWSWNGVGYATPTEACNAMWQQYRAPNQRFIGAIYATPTRYDCSWTTFQYLCPEETGGGIGACGTILPVSVYFYCASGYQAAGDGVCVKDFVNQGPSCSANAGGTRNDTVGNPILITSGAKLHEEEDFATADRRLLVKRYYRSTTQLYNNNPLWPPLGTLEGWAFWFAVEWQLQDTGSSGTLYLPTGEALTFTLDASSAKFVAADPAIGNTDYSIEYVGTPPSDWSMVVAAPSQWRVREKKSGRIWLLQTLQGNESGLTPVEAEDLGEVSVIESGALAAALDALLVAQATHEIEGEVAHQRHVLRAVPLAQPRLVLAEGHVQHPVQGILDEPVVRTTSAQRSAVKAREVM